jgi:hypothetical protein
MVDTSIITPLHVPDQARRVVAFLSKLWYYMEVSSIIFVMYLYASHLTYRLKWLWKRVSRGAYNKSPRSGSCRNDPDGYVLSTE